LIYGEFYGLCYNELVKGVYKPTNISFGSPTLYKWNEITPITKVISYYIYIMFNPIKITVNNGHFIGRFANIL
jgi:hypothetical protein